MSIWQWLILKNEICVQQWGITVKMESEHKHTLMVVDNVTEHMTRHVCVSMHTCTLHHVSHCVILFCELVQLALQLEHDLESETTQQRTESVTGAQSFSLPRKTDRERKKGKRERLPPTRCTQKLIKSFEIATEGTCMQSSQGKGLMRLYKAPG